MKSRLQRHSSLIKTAALLLTSSLALAQTAPETAARADKNARGSTNKAEQPQAVKMPSLNCKGELAAPGKLSMPIGKSTLLRLPEPVVNRTLGNPAVAQAMLVSPETLYLLGVQIGSTNMILQGRSGNCSVVDVSVTMDPAALQATYKELMPEETNIRVSAAADSLVLSGTVADAMAVMRAVDLATAFVRRSAVMSTAAQQEGMVSTGGNQAQAAAAAGNSVASQQARIVNLLGVNAAQQVMLEVRIAEVSKTLLDKLGAGVNGAPTSGSWTYSILSNFLSAPLGAGLAGGLGIARASGAAISLEAEKKDGLVKILAEPNIVAISGQEGSFLAGGKILIPVAQDSLGTTSRVTLEEKEFGVGLKFTPTVLAGGRINLRVAPEVSELSREGVGISLSSSTSRAILPLITTRRASTTVQLQDGQSFAIGGLIKNNTTTNIKAFPILGEIPIIGALFRSTDFQQDRTELVFIVTPRLVKPLQAGYKLPTDAIKDPTRSELFLGGQMEGAPSGKDSKASSGGSAKPADAAGGFELK